MKMNKTILCAVAACSSLFLTSCMDVVRGNKNITYINKTFDSKIVIDSKTDAVVQADKDYIDSGKATLISTPSVIPSTTHTETNSK